MSRTERSAAPTAGRGPKIAWIACAAAIAAATFALHAGPAGLSRVLGPLDLAMEANAAAWFSAASLMASGLILWGAAGRLLGRDRAAAAAAGFLGLLALVLGVDEAGSLHERFDLLVPEALGLSLEKVAAGLAVPLAASVWVLFRRRGTLGPAWAQVLVAYLLFGSVFAQEKLEHAVEWSAAAAPVRLLVEEGTELVGIFLLLLAATGLHRRAGAQARGAAVRPGRGALLAGFVLAAVAGPPLIALSLSIPFAELSLGNRGNFASTPAIALFLIAGFACWERAAAGPAPARRAWRWLAIACVALSLLQNWHAYASASELILGRVALPVWRACYDMAWALPILIALLAATRRRTGARPLFLALLAAAWVGCLLAAWRSGFLLSYASSFFAAVVVAGGTLRVSRRDAAAAAAA